MISLNNFSPEGPPLVQEAADKLLPVEVTRPGDPSRPTLMVSHFLKFYYQR